MRQNPAACLAVYDRGVVRALSGKPPIPLVKAPRLAEALAGLSIRLNTDTV
ncbi:hypothetical protein [Amaricoccus macauensis]|uniref:hypothetical protein n=1 Tax=Amaricoccus macauensis TaxID=57001 RepID=UPI003C7CD134